jgi:hypothetical protein
MTTRRAAVLVVAALLAGLAARPAQAQKAEQTASQFYLAYRAAFDKAKAIEDLLPYLAKKNADQVKATPAAERAQMFGVMKAMGTLTNVKILKEAKKGEGATLSVEGLGPDKNKTTGTVEIVKEAGAWKVGNEDWHSGS